MLLLTSELNIAETAAPSYPSETYPYQTERCYAVDVTARYAQRLKRRVG